MANQPNIQLINDSITPHILKIKNDLTKAMEVGMHRSLLVIRDDAVRKVHIKTGRLRNSLQGYGSAEGHDGKSESVYTVEKDSKRVQGRLGTKVPYARELEYRYPYLIPAFYENKVKIRAILNNMIKSTLVK